MAKLGSGFGPAWGVAEIRGGGRRRLARLVRSGADRWRRRVISCATDLTDVLSTRSTLVLAPHPDDETLGAGGTIARCRAAGAPVTIAVASDGRHSSASSSLTPDELAAIRAAEVRTACRALGVADADLMLLGFEDGTLGAHCSALAHRLREIISDRRPSQILVPSRHDDHPDHRWLHLALLRAVSEGPSPDFDIFAYPVWAWAHGPWFLETAAYERPAPMLWALRSAFGLTRAVLVRTDGVSEAKRKALGAYATQTTNYTGEPTWSWLGPEFCALFTMPEEVLFPIRAGSAQLSPQRRTTGHDNKPAVQQKDVS
jgi:LmbE family N-acetylglucosaminyl deacetylase